MRFVHITSQVEGDPYQTLLQEKGGDGFPYVAFLDAQGQLLAPSEYPPNLENFKTAQKEAEEFRDLMAKAEAGDQGARLPVFKRRIKLRHFSPAQAREKLAELKDLSAADREELDEAVFGLELGELFKALSRDREKQNALGQKILALGRLPKDRQSQEWVTATFLILLYAESTKDVSTFEAHLKQFEEAYAKDPRFGRAVTDMRKKLEDLKKAAAGPEAQPEPKKEPEAPSEPSEPGSEDEEEEE